MVLPRLATYLDAEDCLFLRSRWIVRIFVTADVVTFLTQASGGGMAATGGSMAKIGDHVSLRRGDDPPRRPSRKGQVLIKIFRHPSIASDS